jgi:hypothetical protein
MKASTGYAVKGKSFRRPSSGARSPNFRSDRLTPYLGGDLKDDRYLIGDYMSAVSHSTSRGMSIDHKHPFYIKGVPYILYPVYGAGNTSLYYIGNTSSSVTLAIVAAR